MIKMKIKTIQHLKELVLKIEAKINLAKEINYEGNSLDNTKLHFFSFL